MICFLIRNPSSNIYINDRFWRSRESTLTIAQSMAMLSNNEANTWKHTTIVLAKQTQFVVLLLIQFWFGRYQIEIRHGEQMNSKRLVHGISNPVGSRDHRLLKDEKWNHRFAQIRANRTHYGQNVVNELIADHQGQRRSGISKSIEPANSEILPRRIGDGWTESNQ